MEANSGPKAGGRIERGAAWVRGHRGGLLIIALAGTLAWHAVATRRKDAALAAREADLATRETKVGEMYTIVEQIRANVAERERTIEAMHDLIVERDREYRESHTVHAIIIDPPPGQ